MVLGKFGLGDTVFSDGAHAARSDVRRVPLCLQMAVARSGNCNAEVGTVSACSCHQPTWPLHSGVRAASLDLIRKIVSHCDQGSELCFQVYYSSQRLPV